MVKRLNNDSTDENEHSVAVALQNSSQYDLLTAWSSTWHLVSMDIFNDISDFRGLKTRINSFIQDHPLLINEIKDYFYAELIEHTLKRAFRVTFTINDSAHTTSLFRQFFHLQDTNIRIIFHYFFDDVRLLLLTGKFQALPWSLRQAVIYSPKSILLTLTMTWLKSKEADSLTLMIYRNLINAPQNDNKSEIQQQLSMISFSFDRRTIWLFIMGYIFLLITVNIHSIGVLINCSAGLIIIGFILYYILSYSQRLNR